MPLIYILSSRTGNVSSDLRRKNLELPDLEIFAFIASVFLSLKSWLTWYSDIASVNRLRTPVSKRLVLLTAPLVCLALTLIALTKLAATTVRNDALYISFYLLVGAGWLGGMTLIFPFLGISARMMFSRGGIELPLGLSLAHCLARPVPSRERTSETGQE
jgi:hypothetical protein